MPRRHPGRTRGPLLTVLCAATLAVLSVSPVHGQAVSNPRIAEFDPSPDHWSSLDNGQPAVLRYELGMHLVGATAPFLTVDMGKPSPAQDGKIRFDFTSAISGVSMPAGEFEARVSAIGPEGSASSDASNPFTFSSSGSCSYALSAITFRVPAQGGSYTVNLSTQAGCTWVVTTPTSWVRLWTTGSAGAGTLPFSVDANASASPRAGTITIGSEVVTISQDGATSSPQTTPATTWPAPAASGGATSPLPVVSGTRVVEDASVVADYDAAFDTTRRQYLVVWHTWNAAVKGLLLDAQGRAVGSPFVVETNALAPRVAYSPASQAYLVTYTKDKVRQARLISPAAGGSATLGAGWVLGAMNWLAGHGNAGGTTWVPSINAFLVTWWDGDSTILVRAVGANGPLSPATALAETDTQELPEIACGPTACLVVGRTWDQLVWGRWLTLNGTAVSARFTLEQGFSTTRDWVRVAYNATAGVFTVAWARAGIPQTTSLVAGATRVGTVQAVAAARVGRQLDLAFGGGLNPLGIAVQGDRSDIWVQGLDNAGMPLSTSPATVSEVATTDGRPVIVADTVTGQYLVLYRPTLQSLRSVTLR